MIVGYPAQLHGIENLELIVGRPDARTTSVERDLVDGVETMRVEYVRDDGLDCQMWFAPGKGHQMVKSQIESDYYGARLRNVIHSEVKAFETPTGVVWFPEKVVYEGFRDGEPRFAVDTVLTDLVFNEDIDEARFSLSTMEIPAGTPVMSEFASDGVTKEWTGEKLVGIGSLGAPPKGLLEGGEESRRATMLIISINLALLSGAFLWAYLRSKRRARSQHPS